MPTIEDAYSTNVLAGADLSDKRYYAVKLNPSAQIILSGAGENALGILQDQPASGRVGKVMCEGKSPAIYGASVTAGNSLTPDAAGKLVPATGSDAIVAIAAESGSANEIHSVYILSRATSGSIQKSVLAIPIKLAKVANGDVLTNFTPGFPGRIVSAAFAVTDPVTTASKAATLNLEIGTVNLTGGVISLTSANCTPLGAVIAGTAITANNTFGATDTISVEASSVTAFVEGEGVLLLTLG
jgi:hypothetical protein